MDSLTALWGGEEASERRKPSRAKWAAKAIWVAMIAAIVILMVQVQHIAKTLVAIRDQVDDLNLRQVATDAQARLLTMGVNSIGLRVAKLDNQMYTPLEVSGFRNKDRFAPSNYATELSLFKSMSPAEQQEYLTMTKEAKQAKYGAVLK
jgi:hypothetical protein